MARASLIRQPTRDGSRRCRRTSVAAGGFSLTEMLIVIAVIVLIATIAVPVFNAMTGSRSVEGAENNASAFLARARTEALGLQEYRGVLFFRDPQSQRVGMAMVFPRNGAPTWELDLVPERETVLLPKGVGVQLFDNAPLDRYLGFNPVPAGPAGPSPIQYGGVVLFDRQGRVASDPYVFLIERDPDGPGPLTDTATLMGQFLFDRPDLAGAGPTYLPATGFYSSSLGFVMFDGDTLREQFGDGRNVDFDTQIASEAVNPFAGEMPEETWLDENSIPVLVNRYNGTLIRSE